MFGRKKKQNPSSGCLSNITVWKVPQPKNELLLDGSYVAKVYIYDATPLAEIDPDGFYLTVAYCDGVLESKYTGTIMPTKTKGNVIVMYKDTPVGTIDIRRSRVEQAARDGFAIRVFAFSDGWIQYGSQSIRNVKARVPAEWVG